MDQNTAKRRLRSIAAELAEIAESIPETAEAEPAFPIWAAQRVDDRTCLICEKQILPSQREIRGCHDPCYKKAFEAIRQGKTTESELIAGGLLAPKRITGRPIKAVTALERFLIRTPSFGSDPADKSKTHLATPETDNPVIDPGDWAEEQGRKLRQRDSHSSSRKPSKKNKAQ